MSGAVLTAADQGAAGAPPLRELRIAGIVSLALKDVRDVDTLLGHASVESTRRYARLAENALVEVLRQPAELVSDKRATTVRKRKLSKPARLRVGPPGFEPGRLRL